MRIVSETRTDLPQFSYVPTEKVARAQITQLSFDESVKNRGMGYVITLEDGSYLIVDGGMNQAGGGGQDEVMLYNYLQSHNQRTDGKIVIAAWVFTHEHDDHVSLFLDFSSLYAKTVALETILWNFTQSYLDGAAGNFYNRIRSAASQYGAKTVRVHTGQTVWVRNARLDILFTHESLAPYYISTITTLNDASTVFRVDIAGKRILFLGDVSTVLQKDSAVKVIYGMYGDELKCDILQVGHHGWGGGSTEIYNAARPDIAFWPIESFNWEKVCRYATSKQILNMYENGIIRELYIAKDGQATVSLE